jgi:hypothetical protein
MKLKIGRSAHCSRALPLGSLDHVSLRRLAVACAGSLLAAFLLALGSAPAKAQQDCTWGASSVSVELVDGQYVQTGPTTTGCIPPAR